MFYIVHSDMVDFQPIGHATINNTALPDDILRKHISSSTGRTSLVRLCVTVVSRERGQGERQAPFLWLKGANLFAQAAFHTLPLIYPWIKKTFRVGFHLDAMLRANLRTSIAATAPRFLLIRNRHILYASVTLLFHYLHILQLHFHRGGQEIEKRPILARPLFYRRHVKNKVKIRLVFIVCQHLCQWWMA